MFFDANLRGFWFICFAVLLQKSATNTLVREYRCSVWIKCWQQLGEHIIACLQFHSWMILKNSNGKMSTKWTEIQAMHHFVYFPWMKIESGCMDLPWFIVFYWLRQNKTGKGWQRDLRKWYVNRILRVDIASKDMHAPYKCPPEGSHCSRGSHFEKMSHLVNVHLHLFIY